MSNKIEFFENVDYLAISNFVETKLPNLKISKNCTQNFIIKWKVLKKT